MEAGPDTNGTELITNGALPVLVRRPQKGQGPHPALLMLHGWGANEGDIYELVPFVDKRVLIAAVRAPEAVSDDPRGSYKWYERTNVGEPQGGLLDKSLERLGQLLGQLESLTGVQIDPAQVYVGGFSQGAAMSVMAAATYPDRLAGILPHSGFINPTFRERIENGLLRGKGAFVAHGTEDQVLKVGMGQALRHSLEVGGLDVTYREFPIAHATSPDSRRALGEWLNHRLRF